MDLLSYVLALLGLWLLGYLFRWARFYYRSLQVPIAEAVAFDWITGHMAAIQDRTRYFYDTVPLISERQHRIRRFMVGPFPVMIVSHPETVAAVLKHSTPKLMVYYSLLLPFIGEGLLVSNGKKWARDRRLLNNAFHFNILQEYTPKLHDSAQVLVEKLHQHMQKEGAENKTFDFSEACCLLTLDVMLRCAMGVEINCQLKDSDYTKGVREITQLIFTRGMGTGFFFPDWLYFLTTDGRRLRSLCSMCHNFTTQIINARRKRLQQEGQLSDSTPVGEEWRKITKGQVDFLNILLTVRDEDGTGLSDLEIRDQVDTFLFEGHDTTSSVMQWMFYFLAKHPDVQQRCREEACKFLGEDGAVCHEDLGKLMYITQCIKESLRMCCPVPEFSRQLHEDIQVDEYILPKGSWIAIDVFGLHHASHVYPDPYKFDPDRFSAENSKDRHSHAFIPFSAGLRNCIGQVLATNELRTVVASVLTRFELSVDPALPEPLYRDAIVMRAKNGIKLQVKNVWRSDDNF